MLHFSVHSLLIAVKIDPRCTEDVFLDLRGRFRPSSDNIYSNTVHIRNFLIGSAQQSTRTWSGNQSLTKIQFRVKTEGATESRQNKWRRRLPWGRCMWGQNGVCLRGTVQIVIIVPFYPSSVSKPTLSRRIARGNKLGRINGETYGRNKGRLELSTGYRVDPKQDRNLIHSIDSDKIRIGSE